MKCPIRHLFILAVLSFLGTSAPASTLYVSPSGDDDNSGTEDRPIATLERAQDQIRRIRATGGLPDDGIILVLRGGMYELSQPLDFTKQDSGSENAPIVYQTGQGGVHLEGGDRKTLTPAGHYADNDHIHHAARWDPVYQQAITVFGVGNRATHNLIENVPHIAIGFTGNDQTIEYNEIHSSVFQSNDAGAIYTFSKTIPWPGLLEMHSLVFSG